MAFRERLFLILAGIFIASLVSCNLIFLKFFEWTPLGAIADALPTWEKAIPWIPWRYTFELSVGILPYPVTFLCTDIVSELYGKKKADLVVLSGFVASVFVCGVVMLANKTTATTLSPVNDETFKQVFGLTGAAVFASMMAYLTAQFIDIRVFHFWKKLTKGKHLWLRNNGSTIVSQVVDTSCVLVLLCALDVIAWEEFGSLLAMGIIFKMLCALFDTPLFYLAIFWLKPIVGEDPEFAGAEPID